jgi:hypothetical protein
LRGYVDISENREEHFQDSFRGYIIDAVLSMAGVHEKGLSVKVSRQPS